MKWASNVYYSIAVAFPGFKVKPAREGESLTPRIKTSLSDLLQEMCRDIDAYGLLHNMPVQIRK
jgi:hypothetical protein